LPEGKRPEKEKIKKIKKIKTIDLREIKSLGQEGITAHCVQNILDSLAELLKVNPVKYSTFF